MTHIVNRSNITYCSCHRSFFKERLWLLAGLTACHRIGIHSTTPTIRPQRLRGDTGFEHVALATFHHRNPDFALDPLSSNRWFQRSLDLSVLGTIVVAGPTPESIQVLVPDCIIPPVGNDVVIDLRHVVELSLGAAFDLGEELPPPDLASAYV